MLFKGAPVMLANQPEIITEKRQPSTVLAEDIYGAFDAGQALSECSPTPLIFAASSHRDQIFVATLHIMKKLRHRKVG